MQGLGKKINWKTLSKSENRQEKVFTLTMEWKRRAKRGVARLTPTKWVDAIRARGQGKELLLHI